MLWMERIKWQRCFTFHAKILLLLLLDFRFVSQRWLTCCDVSMVKISFGIQVSSAKNIWSRTSRSGRLGKTGTPRTTFVCQLDPQYSLMESSIRCEKKDVYCLTKLIGSLRSREGLFPVGRKLSRTRCLPTSQMQHDAFRLLVQRYVF